MIALVLEDGLLPQFDPIFLLHFPYHVLQELKLVLLFSHLGIDLDLNLLPLPFFVVLVTSHLREQLEFLHDMPSESLAIEVVAIRLQPLESAILLSLLLEVPEQMLLSPFLGPLVNE